jgi:hypothetical protein
MYQGIARGSLQDIRAMEEILGCNPTHCLRRIFADDGHDMLGAMLFMKFQSNSSRDGVEVVIGPGFVFDMNRVEIAKFIQTPNHMTFVEIFSLTHVCTLSSLLAPALFSYYLFFSKGFKVSFHSSHTFCFRLHRPHHP